MTSTRLLLMVFGFLSAAARASAHRGHGPDGGSESLLHYLTEPLHAAIPVGLAVGVAVAFAASARFRARRMSRRSRSPSCDALN